MTALAPAPDNGHDHGHAPDAHGADEEPHGSQRGYAVGFVLSVLLTAAPFALVMGHAVRNAATATLVIMGLAAVQVVVHMVCFLHMNTKSQGGWTFMALIFTLVLVAIALSGSIWVMHHLNANMMPMSLQAMHNLP